MLRDVRDWYRARSTVPMALYSFDAVLGDGAEWRADRDSEAPAITLHIRPGASASFTGPLRGRFSLEAEVRLGPAANTACTFTVTARRRGRVVRRCIVSRLPGDSPTALRLDVRSTADELTLSVEGTAAGDHACWGSPIVSVPKSLPGLARGAWTRVRSASRSRRHRRGLDGDDRMSRPTPEMFPDRPLVSLVIVAAESAQPESLRRCLDSIEAQSYPRWEVVQASRVADGLHRARGKFVTILAGDGELAPDALAEIARVLDEQPGSDIVYSDEDWIAAAGRRRSFFKPDWSPEYCLSRLYVGQLVVYRKTILDVVEGSDEPWSSAGLLLRVMTKSPRVAHVPKVLWHGLRDEPERNAAWLSTNMRWHGLTARVLAGPRPGCYRLKWEVRGDPLVSIVILTRDRVHLLRRCVESIEARTRGACYEIVIIDNASVEEATRRFLDSTRHTVIRDPAPFNFARLNNTAARRARGEHLLFLNNDTEVIDDDWLVALLEQSHQAGIGVVGAKLYYPDGRLQHVGMVLGLKDDVAQVFRGAPGDHPGYFDSNLVVRNYSAVTGACLMTRREVFDAVGGFDEVFAFDYNDVDYCLRIRAQGYRVVFTPHARLWHHEFITRERRVLRRERALFRRRWAAAMAADPYYNPNLSRDHLDFRAADL